MGPEETIGAAKYFWTKQKGRRQILLKRTGGTEHFWTKRGSRPRKLARTRGRIPQVGRPSEGRFSGGEIF